MGRPPPPASVPHPPPPPHPRYPDCVEKLLTCAADPDGLPVLRRQALRLLAVASAKVASPALFYRAGPYCRTDGWQRDPEPAALPPDLLRRLAVWRPRHRVRHLRVLL